MGNENIIIISIVFILLAFLMAIGFFFDNGDGRSQPNINASEILATNDTPQDYIPLVQYLHPNSSSITVPSSEKIKNEKESQIEIFIEEAPIVTKKENHYKNNINKSVPESELVISNEAQTFESVSIVPKIVIKTDREKFQSLGQNRVGIFKK